MDIHETLCETIQQNKPQEALYYTGELIKQNNIECLQLSWYVILSKFSNLSHFSYQRWYSTCTQLKHILESDAFYVQDAFQLTLQLCLLYRDCSNYFTLPKYTLPSLRTKVIGFFEEDLKLSSKGLQSFQHVLPKNSSEQEFCIKIISGLMVLWGEKKSIEFRNALEYIDRKHFDIEIPSDIHLTWGDTHYSFTIFLWECLCTIEPSFETFKYLYKYQYSRKNHNLYHMPFLYGIHTYLQDMYNQPWSEKDQQLIQHIYNISHELIQQVTVEPTTPTSSVSKFIFEDFYPTAKPVPVTRSYYEELPITKTIVLGKKTKKKYKENKDTISKALPYE